MSSREFTTEDIESVFNKCSKFEVLVAVAVATRELEKEKLQQQEGAAVLPASSSLVPPSPSVITRRERIPGMHMPAAYGRGECSSSAAPKEKIKRNPVLQNRGDGQRPSPPLPEQFKNKIQEVARGRSVTPGTLVIQKKLYRTDVRLESNRLSIPMNQIRNMDFLTDDEKRNLGDKKHVGVKIIEPSLELNDVKLSRWGMILPSSSYMIIGNWNSIVKKNKLKMGIEVQLWSFRVDSRLYFALVRLS